MNKDEPRKLWLQVYDEEGNYMDPEWRTFSADERVNPTDLCYVRWGKTNILCIERDAALARAEEAEARVADLEAQLAAQQWRPVTEKPEKPGWYSVYDSDGHVFYNAEIFPYRVARWTGKWDSAFNGLVDYWRPLPPAPQEPTP